jgi:hypothetical protein
VGASLADLRDDAQMFGCVIRLRCRDLWQILKYPSLIRPWNYTDVFDRPRPQFA